MSQKNHIDFKKEFMKFAQELENSKPIFDDDISFDDFDNLLKIEESSDSTLVDFEDLNGVDVSYPSLDLETDNMFMNIIIKKDYSNIKDINLRKKEFFNDLREFVDEFESTEEANQLMKFYDG